MCVSVSIVTHQSARHLDACLAGVAAQGDRVRELLVADNGSSDDSLARLRRRAPRARVIALPRNVGFAAAHNRNFARARGEFVLALNPDVELRPGYLATLLAACARDARIGAVSGRLLTRDDSPRIDSAGIVWAPGRTRFVDRGRGGPPETYARDEDVFGVCAAAALYRREALAQVSRPGEAPYAERLFMYYEDVDLSWRLRRAGWRLGYRPQATAIHARGGSGASAAFVEYHLVRNRLWVSLRNATPAELLRELPGLALLEAVKCVQSLARPHLRAALADQLRGVRACLAERRALAGAR